jgi:hypothetical protein
LNSALVTKSPAPAVTKQIVPGFRVCLLLSTAVSDESSLNHLAENVIFHAPSQLAFVVSITLQYSFVNTTVSLVKLG